MSYREITLEVKDHIATLTLNRPEQRNTITANMHYNELPAAIEEIRRNDEIRVLILTGAGRAFCAGGSVEDLSSLNSSQSTDTPRHLRLAPFGFFVKDLHALAKPVIVAVNGIAVGAGLSLVMCCDFRIASQQARFGSAFIHRGLMPDCGLTYTLTQVIGVSKSLRLLLLGEIIDAAEAERIGLVDKVVSPQELMPNSVELAIRLAKLPPIAIGLTKQAVYRSLTHDLSSMIDFENYGQQLCTRTEDFQEGLKSFLEKREPFFRGR